MIQVMFQEYKVGEATAIADFLGRASPGGLKEAELWMGAHPKAVINGGVEADRVVVNGKVEGPIRGSEVMLKSHAHVVGDIQCQHLSVERGACFDGRSTCSPQTNMKTAPEKLTARLRKENELKATREPVDASAA
jgi:hypothetical protein